MIAVPNRVRDAAISFGYSTVGALGLAILSDKPGERFPLREAWATMAAVFAAREAFKADKPLTAICLVGMVGIGAYWAISDVNNKILAAAYLTTLAVGMIFECCTKGKPVERPVLPPTVPPAPVTAEVAEALARLERAWPEAPPPVPSRVNSTVTSPVLLAEK